MTFNPMPLDQFPARERTEIERLAALPEPPPMWIDLMPRVDGKPLAQIPSRAWFEWHWRRGKDPERLRESISPALRAAVIAQHGMVCGLCGGAIADGDLHIDHIVPVTRGGQTVIDNLQPAHSRCNVRKGNRQ